MGDVGADGRLGEVGGDLPHGHRLLGLGLSVFMFSLASTPAAVAASSYFSRGEFAAHTNNVVNYCEGHDENSVAAEVGYTPWLNSGAAKERKGRLGLFASIVALGQPMIYMRQEFNVDRPRKLVTFKWPDDLASHGFFQWASRLVSLRRRYPGLRLRGDDPAGAGQFSWILGPWMDPMRGGGRRVIGWRARPNGFAYDALVVLLNFEGTSQVVDLDLGIPGVWVRLASIDFVNDVPPVGTNSAGDETALRTADGRFGGFRLPDSSGFTYKWEAP